MFIVSSLRHSHRRVLINLGLFCLLGLFTTAVTTIYVSSEHTFYYWDYAQYQDMTAAKAIFFRELPGNLVLALQKTIGSIWKSTAQDYSDFHTLLSIPFILAFGNTRLVYILTLTLLYVLPFSLVLGAIATKLIPFQPRAVFWSTALLALLTPASWLPSLRGYPDASSAFLVALAVLAYLHDSKLQKRWQILSIGFCITLAILFRRHFVYAGISLFACIILQALLNFLDEVRLNHRQSKQQLLKDFRQIFLTISITVGILAVIGLPFVKRILSTNFSLLYASYEQPIWINLEHYRDYYGWIACLLAVFGFTAGVFNRVLSRSVARFLALLTLFSIMQWVFKVKQLGFHYSMHFTPWVVLGLSAFAWTAWSRLKLRKRTLVLGLSTAYLAVNFAVGLGLSEASINLPFNQSFINTGLLKLFAASYLPQQRPDYNEIVRLIDHLRNVVSSKQPIYVAASSPALSSDLLWQANRRLHDDVMSYSSKEFWQSKSLSIIQWVPFADSRDPYPLEQLLKSDLVVIATPFQFHLRPEEHDVLKVVVDAFTQNWEFAQDFTHLPEQFYLDSGVTVSLYKRVRPTSQETAIRTLKAMESYMGKRPGGQLNWLDLSREMNQYLRQDGQNSYRIDFYPKDSTQPFSSKLLYLNEVQIPATLSGRLSYSSPKCGAVTLQTSTLDAQANLLQAQALQHRPNDAVEFSFDIANQNSAYLLLEVASNGTQSPNDYCSWSIHDLSIHEPSRSNAARS